MGLPKLGSTEDLIVDNLVMSVLAWGGVSRPENNYGRMLINSYPAGDELLLSSAELGLALFPSKIPQDENAHDRCHKVCKAGLI